MEAQSAWLASLVGCFFRWTKKKVGSGSCSHVLDAKLDAFEALGELVNKLLLDGIFS